MESSRIKTLRIAIIILLNIVMLGLVSQAINLGRARAVESDFSQEAAQVYSQRGSTGDEVRKIQQRLKDWGYFFDEVNGTYGPKTEEAVRYFQRQNGLSVDGIAGSATLAALGLPSGSASGGSSGGVTNDADYQLLARIISAEARGEPYTGQVAVGAVVLNRVEHPSFPDSVAGVVYQPGAFTAITDGQINEPISESAYRAAKDALNGWDPSGGAIYYFNPDKTSNKWMRTRPVILRIGAHLFCS